MLSFKLIVNVVFKALVLLLMFYFVVDRNCDDQWETSFRNSGTPLTANCPRSGFF